MLRRWVGRHERVTCMVTEFSTSPCIDPTSALRSMGPAAPASCRRWRLEHHAEERLDGTLDPVGDGLRGLDLSARSHPATCLFELGSHVLVIAHDEPADRHPPQHDASIRRLMSLPRTVGVEV